MGRVLQVEEKLTYHERVLDFIKYFFASAEVIHFFPFHSINAIYYIRLLFFSSVFRSASTKAGLLGDIYTYIFFCESIFQVIAGDDSFLDCFHMP